MVARVGTRVAMDPVVGAGRAVALETSSGYFALPRLLDSQAQKSQVHIPMFDVVALEVEDSRLPFYEQRRRGAYMRRIPPSEWPRGF